MTPRESKRRLTDGEKHQLCSLWLAAQTEAERRAALQRFFHPSMSSVYRWVREGFGSPGVPTTPRPAAPARFEDALVDLLRAAVSQDVISNDQAWRLLDVYAVRVQP